MSDSPIALVFSELNYVRNSGGITIIEASIQDGYENCVMFG